MKKFYYIFVLLFIAVGISSAQSKASATATITLTVIPHPSVTITPAEPSLPQHSFESNGHSQTIQIKSSTAILVQKKNADGTKATAIENGLATNEVNIAASQNSTIQIVYINN